MKLKELQEEAFVTCKVVTFDMDSKQLWCGPVTDIPAEQLERTVDQFCPLANSEFAVWLKRL